MSTQPSHWFVKDEGDIAGPLTEAEMRQLVMQSSRRTLFVRQGTSDWHPAEVIRNKINKLANSGIYVLANGIAEGPFTFTKAYEVLQAPQYADGKVRTGLNGDWFPAHLWLGKVEELKRDHELQKDGGPLTRSMADVANLAGKFLEQMDKPGTYTLGSKTLVPPTLKSFPWHGKRFTSRTIGIAAGIGLLLASIAFAGWRTLHAYQCRHITAHYRVDASCDPSVPTPNSPTPKISIQKVSTSGSMKVVPGQLFRPTFITTLGRVNAGTAFIAKVPGRDGTLVISSLQLLGPTGGLNTNILATSVSQQWSGLALQDCLKSESIIDVAIRPITFNKSAPFPDTSLHGDIVVCELIASDAFQKMALPLSSRSPVVGEHVWLLADVMGSDSFFHPAVISSIEDGWLVYTFDAPTIPLQATNGAPIVDYSGSVIAVNAAGGEDHGKTIGIGTPVAKFYDYLLSEL